MSNNTNQNFIFADEHITPDGRSYTDIKTSDGSKIVGEIILINGDCKISASPMSRGGDGRLLEVNAKSFKDIAAAKEIVLALGKTDATEANKKAIADEAEAAAYLGEEDEYENSYAAAFNDDGSISDV